jgi:hypothetical protein
MKALLLTLAVLPAVALAQQVVYDNTSSSLENNFPLLPEWRDDSGEAGDDIWLGGTAREVTELKLLFFYRGTLPGTVDLQARFREVDEPTQMPSTAFYDSGVMLGLPTVAGINEYTFAIPNVTVPDHFVWTVQAYNRQGSVGELGPAYYNPPTVGFSDDFFWLSDMGSEWTPYSWGGDPYANFAARLTAVPEPATLAVLALGVLALRRRR